MVKHLFKRLSTACRWFRNYNANRSFTSLMRKRTFWKLVKFGILLAAFVVLCILFANFVRFNPSAYRLTVGRLVRHSWSRADFENECRAVAAGPISSISSDQTDLSYKYCSGSSEKACVPGRPFDPELPKRYNFSVVTHQLVSGLDDLSLHDFKRSVVIATGASSNHYAESIAMITTAQQQFGCLHVIYWDLGLSSLELYELQHICGLEVRTFHFQKYPAHVKDLHTYAWKPLIFLELLKTYSGVLWFDSSARFTYPDLLEKTFNVLRKSGGIFQYSREFIDPYNYTHPHMFIYLPTNLKKYKKIGPLGEGGIIALYKTRKIYEGVLYWLWLCALTEPCISPPKTTIDMNPKPGFHRHRFDQSMLGILNVNLFAFDTTMYMDESVSIATGRDLNDIQHEIVLCF